MNVSTIRVSLCIYLIDLLLYLLILIDACLIENHSPSHSFSSIPSLYISSSMKIQGKPERERDREKRERRIDREGRGVQCRNEVLLQSPSTVHADQSLWRSSHPSTCFAHSFYSRLHTFSVLLSSSCQSSLFALWPCVCVLLLQSRPPPPPPPLPPLMLCVWSPPPFSSQLNWQL